MKRNTVYIEGMHCASCNVLIEDTFSKAKNIQSVKANFVKKQAEICYTGILDKNDLNKKIKQYGYQIVDKPVVGDPFWARLVEISTLAGIVFILYFFAQELHIIPEFNTSVGSTLTFVSVFLLGIVASTSTCMATSGALFMATIGKHRTTSSSLISNLFPAISFNAGRILSYGLFGFIIGTIGNTIIRNVFFSTFMTVFITVGMIVIGLSLTGLVSFSPLTENSMIKSIFQSLERKFIKNPKKTAFLLGAITYLLPCGFTQSVQLYALGLAHPIQSALVMMTFALGTTPLLMALAFTNSFRNFSFYPYFQKIIGIIILAIGINYALNTLSLHGLKITIAQPSGQLSSAKMQNGYQIAEMSVNNRGYNPNTFVVKKDIPVKWVVNGESVFGCQAFLTAPQMKVNAMLKLGKNIFTFTPTETGTLPFSCSMGMYRGQFTVI